MIRSVAVLAAFALTLGAAAAQEAAPAQPAAAAPSNVVIDPAASLNTASKQTNMLTGFYATQAVIDICAVTLDPAVVEGMNADRARLESAVGLDPARAAEAFAKVKADVEKTSPDCADGSPDRLGVDAVTAIYTALPPAPPAATTPPASEGAPAAVPAQ